MKTSQISQSVHYEVYTCPYLSKYFLTFSLALIPFKFISLLISCFKQEEFSQANRKREIPRKMALHTCAHEYNPSA